MSSGSSGSPLSGYLAGHLTAEQFVAAVTAEYYRETGKGKRETLRPIIEVIERAHPGVVELKAGAQSPGFEVRLAERPFPKRYDAELRQAAERALNTLPVSRVPFPEARPAKPGLFSRIVAAVRKLFTA